MISGVLNGPSGCLWYDEGTTKLLLEYLTSMKSYDKQNAISISYTHVTLGCQSRWPLWWSLVHWMDHLSACDMMRWPPCFMESILHEWKAVICRDVNETSYIFVILVCQSKRPLQWSPVHWMDHSAVCDMMRGPPSFFLSILHQWKAGICIILTVHHIQYMCNLSASVKAAPAMIFSALNGTSGCLWYAGL